MVLSEYARPIDLAAQIMSASTKQYYDTGVLTFCIFRVNFDIPRFVDNQKEAS